MSRLNRFGLLAMFAILTMALSAPVFAQGGAGGRGGQRGQGGQGGQGRQRGGDPAAQMERYKTAMAVSDAEWAVINPLLTIVVAKQSAANPRGMRMGGMGRVGRGGAGGGAVTPPTDPISKAQADLTTALADPNATNTTIQAKLKALRDARTKAQAEYKTACDNLCKVLQPRQEAQLVSMNVIQ
jgi:hypothetical protein